MKRIILIFATLIILSSFIPMVHASPSIIISEYTLYPSVFMPGDSGILTLTVKNAETTSTRTSTSDSTTTVTMVGAVLDNIWILPAEDGDREISANLNYEDVGYLAPSASIPISFKLRVDPNMSEGVYFPIVRIDVDSYTDVSFPILVNVSNTTVDLVATSVPSKMSQSGETQITLTAVNHRPTTVSDVTIIPEEPTGVTITPEQEFIGDMAAGVSEEIVFSINPSEKGLKNISFELRYKNGDNIHSTTTTVSLEVVNTFDVAPIITSFPVSITKGSSSKIRIEVYNAKTEKITGVLITPVCNAIVVPSQYFIGAMDPDDVFSASFDIFTDNVDYGSETIGFIVSYKQDGQYYETPVVSKPFQVIKGIGTSYQSQSSSSSTSSSGTQGMPETPSLTMCLSTLVIIIIVIVVVVIIFLRWRKRRKAQ
jgi:hypothetical protein